MIVCFPAHKLLVGKTPIPSVHSLPERPGKSFFSTASQLSEMVRQCLESSHVGSRTDAALASAWLARLRRPATLPYGPASRTLGCVPLAKKRGSRDHPATACASRSRKGRRRRHQHRRTIHRKHPRLARPIRLLPARAADGPRVPAPWNNARRFRKGSR